MGIPFRAARALVVVRRVQRHPLTHRTLKTVQKNVTFGIIPTGLNDFAFHNAHVSFDEAAHLITDQTTIGLTVSALMFAYRSLSKHKKP
jgi:hypothetical protein